MPADRAPPYVPLMCETTTTTDTGSDTPTTERFDIPIEVAEIYEEQFVPALFAEWAPIILDAAGLDEDAALADRVRLLDVACGTGIVARTARQRFGTGLDIAGVDLNPAMLTVARRHAADIDWHEGDVADLPFEAAAFDVAVSQMAAMFFLDRRRAVAEMARVVRPGGRLAWVVPSSLDEQPAYRPFVDIAVANTDDGARALLGTYWNCGDRDAFAADLTAAGLVDLGSRTRAGTARFASPAGLVDTEIDATPLSERIDAEVRARIAAEVTEALSEYVRPGQPFEIPIVCNVVSATKPGRG